MENDKNNQVATKNQSTDGFSAVLGHFSSQKDFMFTFQKAQKLASALYLITGFFADAEPLKWKLRTLASTLIESNLSHKDHATNSDVSIAQIRTLVLEISSLLLVAKQAGLVSEMNHTIISKEFSTFAHSLGTSQNFNETGAGELKPDFFTVDMPKTNSPIAPQEEEKKEMSVIVPAVEEPHVEKDTEILRTQPAAPVVMDTRISESTLAHIDAVPQSKIEITKQFKDYGIVAVKKNSRQSIIINLLKRKKEVMIKDISPLIQGCSEKTIQRELLSMVEAGILKKTGEKRWSRYSLAIEA